MIEVAREGRLYPGVGGIDLKGMLFAMPDNPISIELPNAIEMKKKRGIWACSGVSKQGKRVFIFK